ncbi:hypothetical protein QFC20_001727 [Naganishia adeliensis]|uniref:Uncharacterized protein n=1 Tax=Naganishia adeliensis TaxID=92952 RepID=A0ACC2WR61_9TREE|nr:hypothetical protein QFC20_001727 [Naganishia adeliensis]
MFLAICFVYLAPPLNHMTAAAVGEVLWVLSGESASKLTDEIGYGNAAGILFNKGMGLPPKPEATVEEIPDDPVQASEASIDEDVPRNPITGLEQAETEPRNPMADMTEEEKEREAERMMALFDRMERNPAMQLVENPMKDAVRSGKIEEWERSEQQQELERIREQEAIDEAEAAKEISEWKKRMSKPT